MQTKRLSNLTAIATLAFLTFSISSCSLNGDVFGPTNNNCEMPSGAIVSRTFDAEKFGAVYVPDEWGEVTIEKGTETKVTFEGYENMIDAIDLGTQNDALQFSFNKCFNGFEKLKVNITMPDLKKVTNRTFNAKVHVRGFDGENLDIENDENADMDFDINYKKVNCKINGGRIKLTGSADELSGIFYTTGGLEGFGLETKRANITSNTAWTIEVRASENMTVKINDIGNVRYKGHPQIDTTITGSGKLIDAN